MARRKSRVSRNQQRGKRSRTSKVQRRSRRSKRLNRSRTSKVQRRSRHSKRLNVGGSSQAHATRVDRRWEEVGTFAALAGISKDVYKGALSEIYKYTSEGLPKGQFSNEGVKHAYEIVWNLYLFESIAWKNNHEEEIAGYYDSGIYLREVSPQLTNFQNDINNGLIERFKSFLKERDYNGCSAFLGKFRNLERLMKNKGVGVDTRWIDVFQTTVDKLSVLYDEYNDIPAQSDRDIQLDSYLPYIGHAVKTLAHSLDMLDEHLDYRPEYLVYLEEIYGAALMGFKRADGKKRPDVVANASGSAGVD